MPLIAFTAPAGIIGGLLAYCFIGGANWILDKASELCHTSISGSDTQVPVLGARSFINRIGSNTGGAGQVGAPAACFGFCSQACLFARQQHGLPCQPLAEAHPAGEWCALDVVKCHASISQLTMPKPAFACLVFCTGTILEGQRVCADSKGVTGERAWPGHGSASAPLASAMHCCEHAEAAEPSVCQGQMPPVPPPMLPPDEAIRAPAAGHEGFLKALTASLRSALSHLRQANMPLCFLAKGL